VSASHLLIVNPRSRGGSASRQWPQTERRLRAILPPFDTAFTASAGDATRLAAEAVGRYQVVVAVGGDGTTNEVVNGLVGREDTVPSGVALGVLPAGTGSDFLRTFGVPRSLEGAAGVIARGQRREVDVGRAHFLDFDGIATTRYFINAAEVGLGAEACQVVNRSSKRFGAVVTYLWSIPVAMRHYRDQPVSFSLDGGPAETVILNNAWIANGSYSGGGMRSARSARPDDGLLDVVRIVHAGLLQRLRSVGKLRSGAFVDLRHVDYRTARHVEVKAETRVPVETDGEPVGVVPATFDLLPTRLPVVC
jgi:YegS/Rv2252/BmrU family lipid kinase